MYCKFCDTPLAPGQCLCPNCGGITQISASSRERRSNPATPAMAFTSNADFAIEVGNGVLLHLAPAPKLREHELTLTPTALAFTCGVFDSAVELPCASVTAVLPKQTESGVFGKVHNFFLCFTARGKVYEFEFASAQKIESQAPQAAMVLTHLIAELRRFFHTGGQR